MQGEMEIACRRNGCKQVSKKARGWKTG